MSVTIYWERLSAKKNRFSGGTSSSLEILRKVFGNELHPSDVAILRAMSIASNDKFYEEVADVVADGAIKIFGEY